jgi:hypothetical protein
LVQQVAVTAVFLQQVRLVQLTQVAVVAEQAVTTQLLTQVALVVQVTQELLTGHKEN